MNSSNSIPLIVVICHYKDDAIIGGSLRVGQMLANHMNTERVTAHLIFAYGSEGPVAASAKVPCYFPQIKNRWDWRGWQRMANLIDRIQPDIIHFQDPLYFLRFFLLGSTAIKITHCHGRPLSPPKTIAQHLAAQWQKIATDYFVCINPTSAQSLISFNLARVNQCRILPNAVDVNGLQAQLVSKQLAREKLRLPSSAKLLGMVGRVVEYKGFPDLFKIIEKLPVDWQALVVGNGIDRERLELQVKEIGLGDRFHFIGSLNEVGIAYAAMDALVMLCHHEPFGLVIAEAMACCVPVFGLYGLEEYRELEPPLVDDTVATFVDRQHPHRFLENPLEVSIPESDQVLQPLIDAIATFDPSSPAMQQQIESAFNRVQQHYDVKVQTESMVKIYQDLVAQL